jgi:hypothetical protein
VRRIKPFILAAVFAALLTAAANTGQAQAAGGSGWYFSHAEFVPGSEISDSGDGTTRKNETVYDGLNAVIASYDVYGSDGEMLSDGTQTTVWSNPPSFIPSDTAVAILNLTTWAAENPFGFDTSITCSFHLSADIDLSASKEALLNDRNGLYLSYVDWNGRTVTDVPDGAYQCELSGQLPKGDFDGQLGAIKIWSYGLNDSKMLFYYTWHESPSVASAIPITGFDGKTGWYFSHVEYADATGTYADGDGEAITTVSSYNAGANILTYSHTAGNKSLTHEVMWRDNPPPFIDPENGLFNLEVSNTVTENNNGTSQDCWLTFEAASPKEPPSEDDYYSNWSVGGIELPRINAGTVCLAFVPYKGNFDGQRGRLAIKCGDYGGNRDGNAEVRYNYVWRESSSAVPPAVLTDSMGEYLGDVMYSDARAYINGYPLPAYITDGRTMVAVEDLNNYGFDVSWDGGRNWGFHVFQDHSKAINPIVAEQSAESLESESCPYFHSFAGIFLSGEQAESFAIDGKALVDFKRLAKYGEIVRDGADRSLRLTLKVPEGARGNTAGNVANHGYAAINGDIIYFGYYGGLRAIHKDGADIRIIADDPLVSNINAVGDWIYYRSGGGQLTRVRTDGSDIQKLDDYHTAHFISVIDDWIYYNIEEEPVFIDDRNRGTGSINRIRTNGTDKQRLVGDEGRFMNVTGEWIYYTVIDYDGRYYDGGRIYRVRTDGSDRQKLNDDRSKSVNVADGWIYYSNTDDKGSIYRIRTDGTDKQKLNDSWSPLINVTGDWIYCLGTDSDYSGEPGFYKIRTDGTDGQLIINSSSLVENSGWINLDDSISVVGDWVYYFENHRGEGDDWNSYSYLYRMRLDGTERQRVE